MTHFARLMTQELPVQSGDISGPMDQSELEDKDQSKFQLKDDRLADSRENCPLYDAGVEMNAFIRTSKCGFRYLRRFQWILCSHCINL